MRTQLMGEQFLDLLESVRGWDGLDLDERIASARKVIRFQERQVHHRAPAAHRCTRGRRERRRPRAAVGLRPRPGEALLRDDLLGIFGDPEATGKPAGDDLREGKRTVLIALALEAASAEDRALVDSLLGRDDLDDAGVQAIRRVLVSTGAVEVEEPIATLADDARRPSAGPASVSTPARSRSSRRSSRSPARHA